MKKALLSAVVCMLHLSSFAQISTSVAEEYTLWTVVRTMQCNFMSPGTTGSAQVWDFSGLTPVNANDTTVWKFIPAASGSLFPNASMVKKAGPQYSYYEYSSGGVHLLGIEDSSNNPPDTTNYFNTRQVMQHPITYRDQYKDSIRYLQLGDTIEGNYTDTVESFGQLITPAGTYENVIRMRFTEESVAVISGTQLYHVSYRWYDKDHRTALLALDSVVVTSGAGTNSYQQAWYLEEEDPTNIAETVPEELDLIATYNDNQLVIRAGTNTGDQYSLLLFSSDGRKVFGSNLEGGQLQSFQTPDTPPGMYILIVSNHSKRGEYGIKKLLKQ